jgi:hypothetical protein
MEKRTVRNIQIAITLVAISFPTAAIAQVNYVLLPGFYTAIGGQLYWDAVIVSYKDGRVYECVAQLPKNANVSINCNPQSFAGSVLRGPNVVTMSPRSVGTYRATNDFWQLDQQSGELQLCKPKGFKASCVRFQLP